MACTKSVSLCWRLAAPGVEAECKKPVILVAKVEVCIFHGIDKKFDAKCNESCHPALFDTWAVWCP